MVAGCTPPVELGSGPGWSLRILYAILPPPRTRPPRSSPKDLVLELAFATKELRTVCEDGARALEEYGPAVASALWGRLADLRAASNPMELPLAVSQPGTGASASHIVIELAAGYSLVLTANHRQMPLQADGSVAWERVSRVIILHIDHPRG